MFLKAINEATLLPIDALTFAEISGEVGFDGLELRIEKVKECLKKGKLEDLVKTLDRHRMKAISLNAIEDFSLLQENEFEKLLGRVKYLCDICEDINCGMLIAVPSFLHGMKDLERNFVFRKTSHALKELTNLATKSGVKIGFEFLGFSDCSINSLKDAWEIVKSLDLENLGLVIDTFHFYISDSGVESLFEIPTEKIFLIHINDVPTIPRNELKDKHRIFPGQGIIPLNNIFAALMKKGYRGYVSVELFNEGYWKEDPELIAKMAFDSLKSICRMVMNR